MGYSSSAVARCKKDFGACCCNNGKKLMDITNVVAGNNHVLVSFKAAPITKRISLPTETPADYMLIWHQHIAPLLEPARP